MGTATSGTPCEWRSVTSGSSAVRSPAVHSAVRPRPPPPRPRRRPPPRRSRAAAVTIPAPWGRRSVRAAARASPPSVRWLRIRAAVRAHGARSVSQRPSSSVRCRVPTRRRSTSSCRPRPFFRNVRARPSRPALPPLAAPPDRWLRRGRRRRRSVIRWRGHGLRGRGRRHPRFGLVRRKPLARTRNGERHQDPDHDPPHTAGIARSAPH